MVPAFTTLILAWTIGGICSVDYLNTGGFVGNLVNNSSFPAFILPVITFLVAAFLEFATGTSWGTMALLIPIGAAICTPANTAHLIMPVLGSILAGAVYGDHVAPQIVYASVVAGCSAVGYIIMGIINNGIIALCISILLLGITLFTIYKKWNEKIDYSNIK